MAIELGSEVGIKPACDALDPDWVAAHRQRARMVMPRGSAGDPGVMLW